MSNIIYVVRKVKMNLSTGVELYDDKAVWHLLPHFIFTVACGVQGNTSLTFTSGVREKVRCYITKSVKAELKRGASSF